MDAIFDTFKLRAEAVSAEVYRFAHKKAALNFIVDYLHAAGVADTPQSYAVSADCPFLSGMNKARLSEQVPGLSFEVTRERAAHSKVGISQLDWAMANTGSLVQDAALVDRRRLQPCRTFTSPSSKPIVCSPTCRRSSARFAPSRPTTSRLSPDPVALPTSSGC